METNTSTGATEGSPTVTLHALEMTMDEHDIVQNRIHINKTTCSQLKWILIDYSKNSEKDRNIHIKSRRISSFSAKLINCHRCEIMPYVQ